MSNIHPEPFKGLSGIPEEVKNDFIERSPL